MNAGRWSPVFGGDRAREGEPEMKTRRRQAGVIAAALVWAVAAGVADAQYFGSNKVQYEEFDFQVLATEHFDVYHYPQEVRASGLAARLAERWYERLSSVLDFRLSGRQPLILYASHPDFEQTNAIPGFLGEGTGGVTESLKRRVVMPFAGPLAETDHVLGHELVHAFQYDAMAQMRRGAGGYVPLWVVEGTAEYFSIGAVHAQTAMWLREALRREALPAIEDLSDPRIFPYRYGHALWAFIGGRFGDATVRGILLDSLESGDPIGAIETATGVEIEALTEAWHRAIADAYGPLNSERTSPDATGRRLLESEGGTEEGGLEVGPALSPDGTQLMFLSARNLFSIDLFLADLETGDSRQITSTATDPHFDTLQFIESSGAWDPEGERFALAATRAGHPVIVVLDVESGDRLRELSFPDLGEIFSPTWSPDGRQLAFSALTGGVLDLFMLDLESGSLTRLTDDPQADLQPAWSPDGGRLAFVTDRFTSDFDLLGFGEYRLATIDVDTRAIERLAAFEEGRQGNPQWAPDGRALYFIADPDGVANVYRLSLDGGPIARVTNASSGVTGITPLSPALSVASSSGALAFSVFVADGYQIRGLDPGETSGEASTPARSRIAAVTLPPLDRADGTLTRALDDPRTGLPAPESGFPIEDYGASLSLDFVGQPYVTAGSDAFGSFVGGGVSMLFSDMLGEHVLGTQFQANGGFRDIAVLASYVNKTSRWNWGLLGGQVPYRSGSVASAQGSLDGEPVFIEQTQLIRQTERQIAGLVAYPFSRARRFEVTSGFRSISFDRELETFVFSAITGELLQESQRDLPTADAIHLAEASAALVYDTSRFGVASPILGRRSRYQITPWLGSLNITNVLLDYRQYFMPFQPYTFAFRGMHIGRYGSDAEDERLGALYLGFPHLVRGYAIDSFDVSECEPGPAGSCEAFDRLVGSRLAVGNFEVRFPLVGAFTGSLDYGPLPAEGFVFADVGLAWTKDQDPELTGGSRELVKSAGAGVRLNVLGFLIVELHAARPFDRPGQGWFFGFNLMPGF